jgi:hypothetical protein
MELKECGGFETDNYVKDRKRVSRKVIYILTHRPAITRVVVDVVSILLLGTLVGMLVSRGTRS